MAAAIVGIIADAVVQFYDRCEAGGVPKPDAEIMADRIEGVLFRHFLDRRPPAELRGFLN